MQDIIDVQTDDFDQNALYNALRQDSASQGAIVTFSGLVRDFNQGHAIGGLFLEHYPAMTMHSLTNIVGQARQRWTLGKIIVIHRVGHLAQGDQIVFVGVTSAHRKDAFDGAQFIMDHLKTEAPFWKKETTECGPRWVEANPNDEKARAKWGNDD
ncbi:molybdopterin synthase catalytic subunit MoaE [Paraglaciecola polaris]|uniref:Molybdopterin synthase catalytic subunit n=1 Tax=Paraglaciecola polaris LMG 21857 TaxID=1129793 RepID=K6ZTA8_9ALTE|nr:molybdopterin synthase catalytic subunit MoaE [Paraglaciecola polaris]GAC32063.1 molybdopterin synthase catalytic subunit [Paraglaciecola polaris LMG 21857]|tara:strand:- start:10255 stop:10719 length:465 start_codon:yes stop_codon:yes gene_type:complete